MDETIYVLFNVQLDFVLKVWFSIMLIFFFFFFFFFATSALDYMGQGPILHFVVAVK